MLTAACGFFFTFGDAPSITIEVRSGQMEICSICTIVEEFWKNRTPLVESNDCSQVGAEGDAIGVDSGKGAVGVRNCNAAFWREETHRPGEGDLTTVDVSQQSGDRRFAAAISNGCF